MLRARCTYLTDLSRLRNEALAHSRSAELIQAECDLIRVNKVITRHWLRCPICKLQDARARAAAMRLRPIAAEAPLALLDMAS
jgi:hypothetical protein